MKNHGQHQRIGFSHWMFMAAGVFLGICISLSPHANASDVDATYRKLRVFSQVLTYVQANYVDVVQSDELLYDAIGGMLRDLDPHSAFMRPEEYRKLREDTAGEFGGLGLALFAGKNQIVIEEVFADGAAVRAGLEVGDQIRSIDKESIQGLELSAVIKKLRGIPGTKVVLHILRKGWDKPRAIPLVRRQVRIPSVQGKLLEKGVPYVRVRSFQERTDHEMGAVLADLRRQVRAQGKKDLPSLILDLRDNPGGLLDEGVKVADRFIAKGKIVSTVGRDPNAAEVQLAHREGTEKRYPMVILINGGSASASEILAGALQDHHRAKLVGSSTYGKGSVQTLFGLEDGAGLKLTIARYLTPSGRSITEKGLDPDIPIDVVKERTSYAEAHTDAILRAGLAALQQ